jgi:CubicO group peptidase (beta-lactamase class C family)
LVARPAASAYAVAAAGRSPPVALAEHVAQPLGLAQSRGGTVDVADGDRAAEHRGRVLAHRVDGERHEVVVPGEDLRPVGLLGACRVVVQGSDGGLDLVAPGALGGQRRLEDAHALSDLAGVPQLAVLAVERDDATLGVEARREAGVVEEHEREQPARLRLLGGEGELAGEPDRLGR